MLELLLVWQLSKRLAQMAEQKGQSASWKWLLPPLWFGGEITGGVFAIIVGVQDLGIYVGALIGAFAGAALAWFIVSRLSPVVYMSGFPPAQTAQPSGFGAPSTSAFMPGASSLSPVAPGPDTPFTQATSAAVAAPVAAPGERLAGFCHGCRANVWVLPDGSCPHGHPAAMVRNTYLA
jgi:hypothetical protein